MADSRISITIYTTLCNHQHRRKEQPTSARTHQSHQSQRWERVHSRMLLLVGAGGVGGRRGATAAAASAARARRGVPAVHLGTPCLVVL